MAKKSAKAASSAVTEAASPPPAQLMDLVENFLSEHSFAKAHSAFQKHRAQNGWTAATTTTNDDQSLVTIFRSWETSQPAKNTDDSSSSSEASDDSSDSDSDSESESESEEESPSKATKKSAPAAKPTTNGAKSLKRKAPVDSSDSDSDSSDSSDSDSDSDSSSDSDDEPKSKKQKTAKETAVKSDSDSDSDSDSSDDSKMEVDKDSSDSSSDSDSDSSSDSDSDSDSEVVTAIKVPLPESDDSSSDSSSDSDSEDEKPKKVTKVVEIQKVVVKDSSDTSVTLDETNGIEPPLPPEPTINGRKKQNEPFSRIPKNIKVDPRFASNDYVSMDYSQRAFDDLVVTKGKGFTKEKNKKKRGSYRGGMIDIGQNNAVYFED